VLVLLYPRGDAWHIPLILRPDHMLDHASHVSLPGGVIEAGESSRQAALREFTEELGAPADAIEMLGRLTELYLFASDYRVIPWVGAISTTPSWNPSPREVQRVLEVPLTHLSDPANLGSFDRGQRGVAHSAPCFHFESERIWGATSMVLAELVAIMAGMTV
jgi:8-oxo-dGTP pyrophosphatase MutT (NUDIX family)